MHLKRVAAMSAVAISLAAPRALPAQQPAPDSPARPETRPETRPARNESSLGTTVAQLRATLSDPATSSSRRTEAARRLVGRQTAESRQALREIVTAPPNTPGRVETLLALAHDTRPDPALYADVAKLLNNDNDAVVDAAAQAVAAYKGNDDAVKALTRLALDTRRPRPQRLSAIAALGSLVEQEAAATLVGIVTGAGVAPAAADPALANAAADALLEMTGLEANGHNPGRWAQWNRQNGNRPPAEWKASLLESRAARERRARVRDDATFGELRLLLKEQFVATALEERPARLLRFLRSPSPDVRRVGAGIAEEVSSKVIGGDITPEIRERLLELIGDADPLVRLDVVTALYRITIPDSEQPLDALLAQLAVETDSDVKAAIARKLSNVPGIRQVVELSMLLDDDAPVVIHDAAEAIRRRAGAVVQQDLNLRNTVAQKLRTTIERLAGSAAYLEARRACGEALAELGDPESLDFGRSLLNKSEPPEIRAVGLAILGELGSRASDVIVSAVDLDNDPRVRERGMQALARTGSFEQSAWLVQKMKLRGDADPKVRAAAKQAYLELLPKANPQKLVSEAARRQDDLTLRVEVLKVLIEMLKKEKKDEDVAAQQQSLGADYLKPELNDPQKAILPLRESLDYWRGKGVATDVLSVPLSRLISAMLRSRQYVPLAALAQDLIIKARTDEERTYYQKEIGAPIWKEADRLKRAVENAPDSPERGHIAELVDAALKMNPPLDEFYRSRIEQEGKAAAAVRRSR